MRRLHVMVAAAALATFAASASAEDAKKVPDGKPIFLSYKCSSCHEIATQGIVKKKAQGEAAAAAPATPAAPASTSRKPPDLSGVGMEHKADWIKAYLTKKEAIHDRKHMKLFKGTDAELATLAGWLESLKDEKAAKAIKASEESSPKPAAEPAK